MKQLLIDVATVPVDGYKKGTALHDAANAGSEAVVELLLAKGAEARAKDYRTGEPVLQRAERTGHEGVKRLLKDALGLSAKNEEASPVCHTEAIPIKGAELSPGKDDEASPREARTQLQAKKERIRRERQEGILDKDDLAPLTS